MLGVRAIKPNVDLAQPSAVLLGLRVVQEGREAIDVLEQYCCVTNICMSAITLYILPCATR
jgi:hypothetical protein